jgi:hypothetical protein
MATAVVAFSCADGTGPATNVRRDHYCAQGTPSAFRCALIMETKIFSLYLLFN